MRIAILSMVLLLSACASMLEFGGDKNSRRLAAFTINEILNQPFSEIFLTARPSSDGRSEYVLIEVPDMLFYADDLEQPRLCKKSRRGTVALRFSRYRNTNHPSYYTVNAKAGRLQQRVAYNGAENVCVNEEYLADMVIYNGVRPVHYIHMGHLNNLFFDQMSQGFPVRSYADQCFTDKLTSPLHQPRNRTICALDAPAEGEGLASTYFLSEQRSVLQALEIWNLNITESEFDKSFIEIIAQRQRDNNEFYRAAAAARELKKIFAEKLKEEQEYVDRTHTEPTGSGSDWFAKTLTVAAIAGAASAADVSASQRVEVVGAAAADVIGNTGGTNLRKLRSGQQATFSGAVRGPDTSAGSFDLSCELGNVCVDYTFTSNQEYQTFKSQCRAVRSSECGAGPNCFQTSNGRTSRTYAYDKPPEDVRSICEKEGGEFGSR